LTGDLEAIKSRSLVRSSDQESELTAEDQALQLSLQDPGSVNNLDGTALGEHLRAAHLCRLGPRGTRGAVHWTQGIRERCP
jgi:hypothetical protein